MPVVYSNSFDKNEWLISLALVIGYTLAFKYRKRFPPKVFLIHLMYGIFFGMTFDKTISLQPFDFYDVNDSSKYEIMDLFTYLMYGPYGYFYIYFYDYFKIRAKYTAAYILGGAALSALMEFFAASLGVYHYKLGYTPFYSFPIYLVVLSFHVYLYKLIRKLPETTAGY